MGFHSILPLVSFRSPASIWQNEPSFLIGELLFHFLLAFLCGQISVSSFGAEPALSRRRASSGAFALAALVGSFAGGAGIELLTILSSEIGNFYHSHSMVQLFGMREPAYMLLGCYAWLPCVSVLLARLPGHQLPAAAQCCLAGLLCSYLWGMLDTVGLKFLWWTWHADDPLYAGRILGVPAASTFWIFASTACLSAVLHHCERLGWFVSADSRRAKSAAVVTAVLIGLMAGPLAFLLLMHVPFLLVYHPIVTVAGHSAVWALHASRGLAMFVVFYCLRNRKLTWSPRRLCSLLALQLFIFFAVMLSVAVLADPTAIRRTSFGQPLGPCDVDETVFWGAFVRPRYLCPERIVPERDHFALAEESSRAPAGTEWYTLLGVAREPSWLTETATQAALAVAFVLMALCLRVGGVEQHSDGQRTDKPKNQ